MLIIPYIQYVNQKPEDIQEDLWRDLWKAEMSTERAKNGSFPLKLHDDYGDEMGESAYKVNEIWNEDEQLFSLPGINFTNLTNGVPVLWSQGLRRNSLQFYYGDKETVRRWL